MCVVFSLRLTVLMVPRQNLRMCEKEMFSPASHADVIRTDAE